MAKLSRPVNTTSLIVEIFIQNSGSTTGAGLTGLTNGTSGLLCYYKRNTGTGSVAATLDAVSTLGTYEPTNNAHGAFLAVDATDMPGLYELHVPNNALASGADSVVLYLQGAANMAPCLLEIELTATSNQDGVHGGMTALPSAAAGASGGLHINGANVGAVSYTNGVTISNAAGDALVLSSTGGNGNGINASGNGSGAGLLGTGGATGNGIKGVGGATSGAGINATAPTSGDGFHAVGGGALHGCNFVAGATGNALNLIGGSTSGAGINITTTSGDGIDVSPTAGHGINVTANGTSKHGLFVTGGTAGTSNGVNFVAGTGGVAVAFVLGAARALDAIADTSLTFNDALQCAVASAAGKQTISGTSYTIETPYTATTLRTFTLNSSSAPTSRS
jgi:hypothetical protein